MTNGIQAGRRESRAYPLDEWSSESLRAALQTLPALNVDGLRDCQISAINQLEDSLKEDRPRALIQMATGSGKTFTAISQVYRLLKHADAKRVLFLVDTKNLGEQAEQEFMAFLPNDDNRKFTELYNVHPPCRGAGCHADPARRPHSQEFPELGFEASCGKGR
ncbi:DEAD/DEAH box helicase family protein [Pseudosulfitobacter pseudonitzschiae]|nr:DEAD/DEAH box helicase family protein [Pseudosulfitobacter pseudonitzschiae]MBM1863480.1 DEAD/DEAH box helicase family protein [Pseudosulfitobacter pseudonitzschiae]MBM1907111.1 DEAD/DEAH box helicase family protein [Pseudosulfitobacter pseudonitzschiae]MBM1931456.1 DEAD/DEAH box helicase family protein [Pseudosulfitobacter pseudonitzschiae]MBM1945807.1 DEAD/DEAH box helicase family protein [Pseudosulfitobacter pseudonitzschiae]MBM2013596.1 DEAD/DEAH box helicase family protein [Pseudosulfi